MKKLYLLFALVFLFSISFVSASFSFNGTTYNINSQTLNNSNISVLIRNSQWSQVWLNTTTSNESGWFNMTLPGNSTDNYFYQISIKFSNETTNAIQYVGQSLPSFPYTEVSRLNSPNFYLVEAGTINISATNSSNSLIPNSEFEYQVKDVSLGYPVSTCSNFGNFNSICYVPKNRNYSIMIFPTAMATPQNFVPVSFFWNNFSSNVSYDITDGIGCNISTYNTTTRAVNKRFNVTESQVRIIGYVNQSTIGSWAELSIVPFLSEPGNMIFMSYGTLPRNASAWFGSTDDYDLSTGFYNISIPYSAAETVDYILYAATKNSSYYGGYRNISLSGATSTQYINFTLYGLLGDSLNISMSESTGGNYFVNTSRLVFNLINITNGSVTRSSAHIETTVDYSDYGCKEFTFMEDISQGSSSFSLPLLNITGFKEMNIYSMNYAPKTIQKRTASQLITNPNITLSTFNPGDIDGASLASSIYISLYRSNSSCDVPSPDSTCSLTDSSDLSTFNPLSAIIGGGKISFRMGLTSSKIEIHYVNVDMFASGPPDALFDDSTSEQTSGTFSSAMRFGSAGPKIYDYVMISMPYTEGTSSQTGLNETNQVNMSIPIFYDENWNVLWNSSLNGTSGDALAANNTHYEGKEAEWGILMNSTICTNNVSLFNASRPCYIDTTNNRIWMRIPHFSGTGPNLVGDVVTASSSTDTTTSSGGVAGFWKGSHSVSEEQLSEGFTRSLSEKYRFTFKIESESHSLGVIDIKTDSVIINISSDPQQATLKIGDERRFEVTNDNYYDIFVKLNSIEDNKANITIKSIYEEITEETISDEQEKENEATGKTNNETQEEETNKTSFFASIWFWILLILVLIVIIIIILVLIKKSKKQ